MSKFIEPKNQGVVVTRGPHNVVLKQDNFVIFEETYTPDTDDIDALVTDNLEPKFGKVYLLQVTKPDGNIQVYLDVYGEYFTEEDAQIYNSYSEDYDKVTAGYWVSEFDRGYVTRQKMDTLIGVFEELLDFGRELLED